MEGSAQLDLEIVGSEDVKYGGSIIGAAREDKLLIRSHLRISYLRMAVTMHQRVQNRVYFVSSIVHYPQLRLVVLGQGKCSRRGIFQSIRRTNCKGTSQQFDHLCILKGEYDVVQIGVDIRTNRRAAHRVTLRVTAQGNDGCAFRRLELIDVHVGRVVRRALYHHIEEVIRIS